MNSLAHICAAAVAVVGVAALTSSAPRAEECKEFSAAGEHFLESWAPLMAKQGAVNIAEARGYHVVGEAKLIKCQPGGLLGNECFARVKACK